MLLGAGKGPVAKQTASLERKGHLRREVKPGGAPSQLIYLIGQAITANTPRPILRLYFMNGYFLPWKKRIRKRLLDWGMVST